MSRGWEWKSGDHWVVCDVCSKQTRASSIRKRWDGLLVCPEDFEHRHPQDLIKVRKEDTSVPFSRVEPADQFVVMNYRFNFNDTVSVYDNLQRELIYNRSLSDTASITDVFSSILGLGFLDTITPTDGFSFLADFQPGFVDTASVSESFIISSFFNKTINGHVLNSTTLG